MIATGELRAAHHMLFAVWQHNDLALAKLDVFAGGQTDPTTTFGNDVEQNQQAGLGLQKLCYLAGWRRLVRPGRGSLAAQEDGA